MYQEVVTIGMTMDDLGRLFEAISMLLVAVVLIPITFAAVAGIAFLVGRITRQILKGDARKRYLRKIRTIITEYEAPFDLRPAEVAYLYDTTIGKEEVLATVFDLERRGQVTLTSIEQKGDFLIQHLGDHKHAELHDIDSHVLAMIGSNGSHWRTLEKEVTQLLADGSLGRVIEHSLIHLGLLRAATPHRLDNFAIKAVTSAAIVVIAFILVYNGTHIVAGALIAQLAWVPFLYQDLLGYIHKAARLSQEATPLLARVWPRIEGFCEFVKVVELDRIKFNNKNDRHEYRHAVLPYAIALNLSTDWQDRFK